MRDWLDDLWSEALVAFQDFADRQTEPEPETKKGIEK
jgi:hypothetical protein